MTPRLFSVPSFRFSLDTAIGKWSRVATFGEKAKDGAQMVFDASTLGTMVDNAARRGDPIAVCADHLSAYVAETGQQAPALAWFDALAVVAGGQVVKSWNGQPDASGLADGLYARMSEITPRGADPLHGLANYKFLSPMFSEAAQDEAGHDIGMALFDVAATNTPFQAGTEIQFHSRPAARALSTAESALHVPGPIGEDKPNMGAHAMAYKVGDRVEVQVYPDKWYPGVVHRVGGNTAGIGVTYTDGFDGKEYRADFDEDRGKVRKMSATSAHAMATPVQLPTDAQLGEMKASKIAEVYREYVAWVRSQPSSEQWQFGDMQRKLQAAFKVAQEQERLGMSAVTMSTPIVSDSTGQMFAPGERVQTPDGMGTVSAVQPDGSGGGTCDVTVNGAVKRYDCKRVKVMSATVQMRATVRFKPGIQSAKHDGESGIVVGVNRNADVWNPVTRSMQTGTALRVRWPDGSEQEYPADWLIEMSATGAGVQTMAQVGDLVICPWCEGQTRIVAGGAMEDHWMNKNGNGPCPGSGKTPEAAKADRNRPIAVPPRGWMSASGSATMMAQVKWTEDMGVVVGTVNGKRVAEIVRIPQRNEISVYKDGRSVGVKPAAQESAIKVDIENEYAAMSASPGDTHAMGEVKPGECGAPQPGSDLKCQMPKGHTGPHGAAADHWRGDPRGGNLRFWSALSRGTPIRALSGTSVVSGPVLFARGSDVFVQTPGGVVKASAKTAVVKMSAMTGQLNAIAQRHGGSAFWGAGRDWASGLDSYSCHFVFKKDAESEARAAESEVRSIPGVEFEWPLRKTDSGTWSFKVRFKEKP